MKPNDAELFASWLQRDTADASIRLDFRIEPLTRLIADGFLRGVIIEYRRLLDKTWTMAAIGSSCFVTAAYADAIAAAPQPWVFPRLVRDCLVSRAPLLATGGIAQGNKAGGLDIVLHYMQQSWDLEDPLWYAVIQLANTGLVRDHAGYRLRRAFQEDWLREPDIYLGTGYRRFAALRLEANGAQLPGAALAPEPVLAPGAALKAPTERVLYFADRTMAAQTPPGSPITSIFHYRAPRCFFSDREKQILTSAQERLTDEEIAARLGISRDAVKQGWRRIYERIEKGAPHVVETCKDNSHGDNSHGDNSHGGSHGGRGREKRRLVVEYIKEHPQELRPYPRPLAEAAGSPPGKAR